MDGFLSLGGGYLFGSRGRGTGIDGEDVALALYEGPDEDGYYHEAAEDEFECG